MRSHGSVSPVTRRFLFLGSVTLFALVAPQGWSDDLPVIGFWESAETSRGGIGTALEFRSDGTFRQSVVVLVETGYRLDGEELIVVDDAGRSETLPVTFGAGTMEQAALDGSVIQKKRFRVPSSEPSMIVGDWSYDYLGLGVAYERYTAEGRMFFRLVMSSDSGSYEVNGEKIRLKASGSKAKKWRFSRDGAELLIGPKGHAQRYVLREEGQWYGAGQGSSVAERAGHENGARPRTYSPARAR